MLCTNYCLNTPLILNTLNNPDDAIDSVTNEIITKLIMLVFLSNLLLKVANIVFPFLRLCFLFFVFLCFIAKTSFLAKRIFKPKGHKKILKIYSFP